VFRCGFGRFYNLIPSMYAAEVETDNGIKRHPIVSRHHEAGGRSELTLLAESFNLSNQVNRRVDITDDGFLNSAGPVHRLTQVGKNLNPALFVKNSKFLVPTSSYAPRQAQLSLKASF
jgi:hypothetical protein